MTRVAPVVPAESDLLCEACGYVLNGLPEGSNCPECGTPIVASLGQKRRLPTWEATRGVASFLRTSAQVIFQPTHFFQTTTTRGDEARAATFARIHWIGAAFLFALTGAIHTSIFYPTGSWFNRAFAGIGGAALLAVLVYLTLHATTWAATRLTAWEAAYRGLRLPLGVVRRGMSYHAAHYLPVALLALITVAGYRALLRWELIDITTLTIYLYVLCAEVVIGAGYLFKTYWIGMKNMMFANK